MSGVDNKAVFQRAIENWNGGNPDAYLELYDPNVVLHHVPPDFSPGITGVKRFYEGIWAAFSKSQIVIHDLFAEGDKVACRYTYHATHQATGEDVTIHSITTLHFLDGKCVERWDADEN